MTEDHRYENIQAINRAKVALDEVADLIEDDWPNTARESRSIRDHLQALREEIEADGTPGECLVCGGVVPSRVEMVITSDVDELGYDAPIDAPYHFAALAQILAEHGEGVVHDSCVDDYIRMVDE